MLKTVSDISNNSNTHKTEKVSHRYLDWKEKSTKIVNVNLYSPRDDEGVWWHKVRTSTEGRYCPLLVLNATQSTFHNEFTLIHFSLPLIISHSLISPHYFISQAKTLLINESALGNSHLKSLSCKFISHTLSPECLGESMQDTTLPKCSWPITLQLSRVHMVGPGSVPTW